jgi:alanine racemase
VKLKKLLPHQKHFDIWYEYTQKCVSGTFTECVLQIDTGLSRNGISVDETINNKKLLDIMNLKFIMSHLACGSTEDSPKNTEQLNLFKKVVDVFGHNIKYSLTASACLNLGKEYYFDIVRIGTGIHGFMTYPGLENVISLYTRILQTRTIHRGDTVGYDCVFTADRDVKVATLAIGFGNGLTREKSSKYKFFINNIECRVLGDIAMDCTMIDVSCIDDKYLHEGTWCQCLLNDTYDIEKLSKDLGVSRSEIMIHLKLSRYYIQGNV